MPRPPILNTFRHHARRPRHHYRPPTSTYQNYRFFDDFAKDAAAGTLANYTFLDPSYFDLFGAAATDQHPDHDVAAGEELIRGVYEAVRQSPLWENTLLLITYGMRDFDFCVFVLSSN
jgi:hypothetical protein